MMEQWLYFQTINSKTPRQMLKVQRVMKANQILKLSTKSILRVGEQNETWQKDSSSTTASQVLTLTTTMVFTLTEE